jgi:LmbE family N-acetylglucosaminyl deacetylase
MATVVFFHAHPDDEAIATGGTMAKMASEGHRVILVTATRGELGEVPEGMLEEGETLGEVRERELALASKALGVSRLEFLGYRDSGMLGESTNQDSVSFWQADLEEAARRLASILEDERAEVLTTYDEHGGYGHPDHVQVHRVGVKAAELAQTPLVFMATPNRDAIKELMSRAAEFGVDAPDANDLDIETFGEPAERITTGVDVSGFLEPKRQAMRAHSSQIAESSFFLSMPDEAFAALWGTEYFIRLGADKEDEMETSLLQALPT